MRVWLSCPGQLRVMRRRPTFMLLLCWKVKDSQLRAGSLGVGPSVRWDLAQSRGRSLASEVRQAQELELK